MATTRTVILGVTGSIAAYKAAEIASQLVKLDCTVHAVLTRCATRFITPLTLQTLTRQPVVVDLFEEEAGDLRPTHLQVADAADLLLIAPATANVLAKLAHGLADDALTTIALAVRRETKLLIAPAMNGKMWDHPATVANVETLRRRGVEFIGPERGLLACGYEGLGRLWPVEQIVARVREVLGLSGTTS